MNDLHSRSARSFRTSVFLVRYSIFISCLSWSVAGVGQDTPAPERFTVTGTVMDESGDPVAHSVVIPLSEFGVPLLRSDATPATMMSIQEAGGEDFVLFTQSDADGKFSFELPAGKYRIGAQSWPGKTEITDLLERNGGQLRIDGIVEYEFASEMEASEPIAIRPIGACTVKVTSQESGDLVLISTEPLAGDPALGFMALTGTFWSGLVGGAAMKDKELTVSGLPAGEVSFYVFVNDNNGGWGGAKTTVVEGHNPDVYAGLLAGWSNAHKTPPPELEELTDYFMEHPDEAKKLNEYANELMSQYLPEDSQGRGKGWIDAQLKVSEHLQDEYELASGETVTLADAWAANTYARMNR
ncbi:MAG: carboxypeptidase-like regulatory domain-containing protein [Pirellulaceae bacterium]